MSNTILNTHSESHYVVCLPELDLKITAQRGDNLLELLQAKDIELAFDCGGFGTCKKCQVSVCGSNQLACLTYITKDIDVFLLKCGDATKDVEHFEILSAVEAAPQNNLRTACVNQNTYAIAIDLGTTTVVGKLIDLKSGYELASFSGVNRQRCFGSDVMSRISAAASQPSTLSKLIVDQIDGGIRRLLRDASVDAKHVLNLVIAGNTAMIYLLLSLPCRSLGEAPFVPEYPVQKTYTYEHVFGQSTLDCTCTILPFISAFVGGDIVSGLCVLSNKDDYILIDLGTNGELVYKRGDRLICSATAAGPAFEGACIECGLPSIKGAISHVWIDEGRTKYKTIGDFPAKGICGSGILDTVAVLLELKVIDKTGAFDNAQASDRFALHAAQPANNFQPVYFSQKDVRQFQLAKSAIRAGLEVIIKEMDGSLPSKLFLAGGFGQNLSPKSAAVTGLVPKELKDRIVPIGNASLKGAIQVCINGEIDPSVVAQINNAQEINLATHPLFGDLFMEHMSF